MQFLQHSSLLTAWYDTIAIVFLVYFLQSSKIISISQFSCFSGAVDCKVTWCQHHYGERGRVYWHPDIQDQGPTRPWSHSHVYVKSLITSLLKIKNNRELSNMGDVAANNQMDVNCVTEPRVLGMNSDSNDGLTDQPSPDPTPCRGADQQPLVSEAVVSTELGSEAPGDVDSDATESADSENDMELPPEGWELRRSSSSSSIRSGEDIDADTLVTRRFMKSYVLKVFHGK